LGAADEERTADSDDAFLGPSDMMTGERSLDELFTSSATWLDASDDYLKDNPAVPGGPLTSMPA
jgi:hypothetical protein